MGLAIRLQLERELLPFINCNAHLNHRIETVLTQSDITCISLLYANRTPQDILLKENLETLQRQHPDRLVVTFVVDSSDSDWKGNTGLINSIMLKQNMPVTL